MSLPRGIVDPNRTPRPHLDPLPEDDHPEAVPPSSLDIVFSCELLTPHDHRATPSWLGLS